MRKIQIGDKVPAFRLPNQDGRMVDIRKYIGKPLVIYFYPKDNTPGCTAEACSFRDAYKLFQHSEAIIFGISGDSIASHKSFRKKYNIPYDLLSDKDDKVRQLFGVPADLFGFIPGRVTYVIDRQARVRFMYDSQLNATKHAAKALEIIKAF